MSVPVLLAVGLLGGLGAIGRFLAAAAVDRRAAILAVNVSGTLLAGLLAGLALANDADLLLAGGLLGAYTTFSTWMLDSERLARGGRLGLAVANVAGSLALGLAAIRLGRVAGHAF